MDERKTYGQKDVGDFANIRLTCRAICYPSYGVLTRCSLAANEISRAIWRIKKGVYTYVHPLFQ